MPTATVRLLGGWRAYDAEAALAATKNAQNTVHRFWISGGGIGVPPGTGVTPVGKRDPPELPNIFGERRCSGVDVCGPAQALPPPGVRRGGAW